MIAHTGPISGVAAGPGLLVATAGYDNRVILWREREALAVATHDHLANQCTFSPCGTLLASASSDYTARLWSVPDLRLRAVFDGHDDDVEMIAFDPKGQRVATASRDHGVRIFRNDGTPLLRLRGHDADVLSVTFCEGGRELVSCGDDGTVRRWCTTTGDLRDTVDLGGVETDSVVVGPSRTLIAGNDHGEIVVLGPDGEMRIAAHEAGIKRLVFDSRRGRLLSASYDGTLCVWRWANGDLHLERRTPLPPIIWARSADFDRRGRVVIGTFGSSYGLYCPREDCWDTATIEDTAGINAVLWFRGSVYTVGDAGRVRRDGAELSVLGSLCNFLAVWQGRVVTGGHLGVLFDACTGARLVEHECPLNCAIEGPSGELVVGTYTGEGLVVRAVAGGARVEGSLRLHDQAVKGVTCSGSTLFSVSAAGDATWTDLGEGSSRTLTRAHDRIANGVAALPDGRFASISRDRLLRLWRTESADAEHFPTPHKHSIKCVAVSRDGQWIATGSYDGTLGVFDVRARAFALYLRPTTAGISCVSAGGDPATFIASAYDGTLHHFGAGGMRRT